MSSEKPHLPKYKLAKRPDSEETTDAPKVENSPKPTSEETPKAPLELRKATAQTVKKDSLLSTSDMLEDAYGAENRARQKKNLVQLLKRILFSLVVMCLVFAGTLSYAHLYKGWSLLEPSSWYLPFLLSSVLSAWLCLKSLKLWKDRNRSLALTGLLIASAICYWNIYVLDYATRGTSIQPNNAFWIPTGAEDLEITAEFNALRGVGKNITAYTSLSNEAYYQAFNALDRENWRPFFEHSLSNEELAKVTPLNIIDRMHLVVERMQAERIAIWLSLQEQLEQPTFEFKVRQVLLKPYTWLLGYL